MWVLVADDAHARVFSRDPRNVVVNRGAHQADEILTWTLRELPDLTVQSSHGTSLPADMADRLNRRHAEGKFDGIVIVAPPAWLGEIRSHLSPAVRDAVMSELPKDLTKLPRARLLQQVIELLPSREGAPT